MSLQTCRDLECFIELWNLHYSSRFLALKRTGELFFSLKFRKCWKTSSRETEGSDVQSWNTLATF